MIICPACHQKEIAGTLFCSECGAQLMAYEIDPPETAEYPRENASQEAPASLRSFLPQREKENIPFRKIALKIVESEQVLDLSGSEDFTLGRVGGNQPILPDVDLTPFQAYESGVAPARYTENSDKITWITDLGSANGTRVNGKKFRQHAVPTEHEDILTLGNLKVQILIHENE
jgi:hypothetical protein